MNFYRVDIGEEGRAEKDRYLVYAGDQFEAIQEASRHTAVEPSDGVAILSVAYPDSGKLTMKLQHDRAKITLLCCQWTIVFECITDEGCVFVHADDCWHPESSLTV